MKTCGNKECFFAVTGNQILEKNESKLVIALINAKGICDETACERWIEVKKED